MDNLNLLRTLIYLIWFGCNILKTDTILVLTDFLDFGNFQLDIGNQFIQQCLFLTDRIKLLILNLVRVLLNA